MSKNSSRQVLISLHYSCCCSVPQTCLTLCDPTDCSEPGLPVLHCLLGFAQIHLRWVSDAIQPSHPLSPSSPPALNLSQHQGLFQWIGSSHQMAQSMGASASVSDLPMNIQGWFPLGLTGWSPRSPGNSQESSPVPQFKRINSLVPSLLYIIYHHIIITLQGYSYFSD